MRISLRSFLLACGLCTAALALACENSSVGMGIGVSQPGTKWGGNNGRPPVFVGGPSWP